MQKIISVTSGKGGVGKTLTTINLALAARASGLSVLIVDGDMGMSNVDILLGIQTTASFNDVLDGTKSIHDIIVKGPRGIDLIPSGSGIARMGNLGTLEQSCILHELAKLPNSYDVVFVDTGAGISPMVLALNSVSDAMLVVTTPEPHALTDAYALIKVMSEEYDRGVCGLVINQVRSDDESMRISERLVEVARQYCGVRVVPMGGIRTDSVLARSIMARRVGWDGALNTLAGQGWASCWRKLYESINKGVFGERSRPLADVWNAMSGKHETASIA